MINLFEVFDKKTITLYNSFRYADIKRITLCIEEDGFLPEDIITPYKFFSNYKVDYERPLYFNEVEIPRYWTIEGTNNSAIIKDGNIIKGKVIYKSNFKHRIIERVEWLNTIGKTQYIDHYDKNGFRYAQTVMDTQCYRRVLKNYFDSNGKICITENFITNDIMLVWKGKEMLFESKVKFVQFFLRVSGLQKEEFMINTFSLSYAVILGLNSKNHCSVFYQGDITDEIIPHVIHALNNKSKEFQIIVPSSNYSILTNKLGGNFYNKVICGGYVYNFLSSPGSSKKVLTLTNSDQIPHLEAIVGLNPALHFFVVALTEMSSKLIRLNKYRNITLLPNAKINRIKDLYRECGVYLDINKGNEILDAVRGAFDYQLLIIGYKQTAHNFNVTAPENLIDVEYPQKFNLLLNNITKSDKVMSEHLQLQYDKASSINKRDFLRIMTKKE